MRKDNQKMQLIKFTKLILYSINFTFLIMIVILINDMNGGNSASKIYEDDHLLYHYFASLLGFLGLQINSEFFILVFIGLNMYGLYSSINILNFYFYTEVSLFEKDDMRFMVNHYNGTDDSLSNHMHTYHQNLRCCGLYSKADYKKSNCIPYSCCLNVKLNEQCSSDRAFNRGCWEAFSRRYYFYKDFNLALESIVFLAQVVSIIFSIIFIKELIQKKVLNENTSHCLCVRPTAV